MIYLYVKEHTKTGLKYFGKTKRDPYKYRGSGTYWKLHINKYGKDHINTIKVWKFEDVSEAKEFALNFSLENNIIDSKNWANLVLEDVTSGFIGKTHSDSTKEKMKNSKLGKTLSKDHVKRISESLMGHVHTDEVKKKISNSVKGFIHTEESKLKMRGKRKPQPKTRCPHCKITGGASALKRYHFDNCKLK